MTIKVKSVQYIYDPDAAKKWFSLWVDIVKEELVSQMNTNSTEDKREEDSDEEKRSLLP